MQKFVASRPAPEWGELALLVEWVNEAGVRYMTIVFGNDDYYKFLLDIELGRAKP